MNKNLLMQQNQSTTVIPLTVDATHMCTASLSNACNSFLAVCHVFHYRALTKGLFKSGSKLTLHELCATEI